MSESEGGSKGRFRILPIKEKRERHVVFGAVACQSIAWLLVCEIIVMCCTSSIIDKVVKKGVNSDEVDLAYDFISISLTASILTLLWLPLKFLLLATNYLWPGFVFAIETLLWILHFFTMPSPVGMLQDVFGNWYAGGTLGLVAAYRGFGILAWFGLLFDVILMWWFIFEDGEDYILAKWNVGKEKWGSGKEKWAAKWDAGKARWAARKSKSGGETTEVELQTPARAQETV